MYDRVKIASKKPKVERFKTTQTQKNRFNNHSSPLDQILFLQRTIGNQVVERLIRNVHSPLSVVREQIQAKLKIGQPNDIYEQEADRVAEQIVSSSWSVVNNQIEEGGIQRQTDEEERKREEEETLQLKKMQGNIPEVTPDLESRIQSVRGSGQPLPKSIRAFFESRFGYDFSQVRIHNDPEGAKLARALNAEAFTYGRDIYFGEGRYNLSTLTGKRLLAHELVHVVQQTLCNSRIELQRVVEDITQMSIDEDWARRLGDYELEQQIQIVRDQLMTCSYSSPECEVARTNLQILEQELIVRRGEKIKFNRIYNEVLRKVQEIKNNWKDRLEGELLDKNIKNIEPWVLNVIGHFVGLPYAIAHKFYKPPQKWRNLLYKNGIYPVAVVCDQLGEITQKLGRGIKYGIFQGLTDHYIFYLNNDKEFPKAPETIEDRRCKPGATLFKIGDWNLEEIKKGLRRLFLNGVPKKKISEEDYKNLRKKFFWLLKNKQEEVLKLLKDNFESNKQITHEYTLLGITNTGKLFFLDTWRPGRRGRIRGTIQIRESSLNKEKKNAWGFIESDVKQTQISIAPPYKDIILYMEGYNKFNKSLFESPIPPPIVFKYALEDASQSLNYLDNLKLWIEFKSPDYKSKKDIKKLLTTRILYLENKKGVWKRPKWMEGKR